MKFLFRLLKGIFSFTLLLGCLFFYAIFIEPSLLTVKEVYLNIDNFNSNDELTIAQFSDTHLGFHYDLDDLEKAVEKINSLQPDLIVFSGDLIDNAHEYEDIANITPILQKLEAPLGKFAVYGNHDYGGGAMNHYQEIMIDSGFTLLVNATVPLTLNNGSTLAISGLDEAYFGEPDPDKLEEMITGYPYHLLLLHEPDIIDSFSTLPNLALAGHSHGGQIQIPFFGPLITTRYAEKYIDGSYQLTEDSLLYVNTGLGTTRFPMRFANVPEITFFHLQFKS